MAIIYNIWWRYASTGRRLIGDDVPDSRLRAITPRVQSRRADLRVRARSSRSFSPLASVFLTFAIAAFYLPSAALFER